MLNRLVDSIQFSSGRGLSMPRESPIQGRAHRSARSLLIRPLGKALRITATELLTLLGAFVMWVGYVPARAGRLLPVRIFTTVTY